MPNKNKLIVFYQNKKKLLFFKLEKLPKKKSFMYKEAINL